LKNGKSIEKLQIEKIDKALTKYIEKRAENSKE
jgi:hypothetical protein